MQVAGATDPWTSKSSCLLIGSPDGLGESSTPCESPCAYLCEFTLIKRLSTLYCLERRLFLTASFRSLFHSLRSADDFCSKLSHQATKERSRRPRPVSPAAVRAVCPPMRPFFRRRPHQCFKSWLRDPLRLLFHFFPPVLIGLNLKILDLGRRIPRIAIQPPVVKFGTELFFNVSESSLSLTAAPCAKR